MLPPENITKILMIFFVEELLYAFMVSTTKISIILFYLRIFREPWFRTVCYILFAATTCFGIWHIMQIIFVSSPISYSWTFWDGEHIGQRGKVQMLSFVNSGINITLDLCLFVLPVTQFIHMSWTLRTKIGTSLIFLTGLIVTVASCIRLETLREFGDTRNPTYDLQGLSTWSLLELHLSVICACLPGMRSFFRRLLPSLWRRKPSPEQNRNQPRTGRSLPRAFSLFMSQITTNGPRNDQHTPENAEEKTSDMNSRPLV
ncbi:CFEM domain-containing protein [Colletotrichum truncatum]|uniref:CFEM domain-containing protein n=1 Tax=Colletotrichum truncatum TaxID=5467 RepID=A0ACC3ZBU0_COLTU